MYYRYMEIPAFTVEQDLTTLQNLQCSQTDLVQGHSLRPQNVPELIFHSFGEIIVFHTVTESKKMEKCRKS